MAFCIQQHCTFTQHALLDWLGNYIHSMAMTCTFLVCERAMGARLEAVTTLCPLVHHTAGKTEAVPLLNNTLPPESGWATCRNAPAML